MYVCKKDVKISLFFSANMPQESERHKTSLRNGLKKLVNVSIWKKKRYVVWAVSIPLALFG